MIADTQRSFDFDRQIAERYSLESDRFSVIASRDRPLGQVGQFDRRKAEISPARTDAVDLNACGGLVEAAADENTQKYNQSPNQHGPHCER